MFVDYIDFINPGVPWNKYKFVGPEFLRRFIPDEDELLFPYKDDNIPFDYLFCSSSCASYLTKENNTESVENLYNTDIFVVPITLAISTSITDLREINSPFSGSSEVYGKGKCCFNSTEFPESVIQVVKKDQQRQSKLQIFSELFNENFQKYFSYSNLNMKYIDAGTYTYYKERLEDSSKYLNVDGYFTLLENLYEF